LLEGLFFFLLIPYAIFNLLMVLGDNALGGCIESTEES
jgi:hypothetical protein